MDREQIKLRRGERVVWEGMPEPHYIFLAFVIRFLVGWSVIIACLASAYYFTAWILIPGLPVILVAGWRLDEARLTWEKDSTTRYAVTNRRAIITQEKPRKAIETVSPNDIGQVEFRNSRFGVADVLFKHYLSGARFGPDAHIRYISTGFLRTKDRDGARDALEAISTMDPRDRLPPDKVKIINVSPAISK
jgi:hypothetical protein